MKERLHILTILFKGCKAIYLICYANFIGADIQVSRSKIEITVLITGFSCKNMEFLEPIFLLKIMK